MTAIIVILLVAGVISQILSVVRLGKYMRARWKSNPHLFVWYDLREIASGKNGLMAKFIFLTTPTRDIAKSFFLMWNGAALMALSYLIRNTAYGGWPSGEELPLSTAEEVFGYFTCGVAFLFFFPILCRFLYWFWHKCMD